MKNSYTNNLNLFIVSILLVLIMGMFSSCRKMEVDENAKLQFSTSMVSFDTVFTTVGSVTKRFMVRNTHDFSVTTSVRLAGGKSSYFSMNVDGVAATEIDELEIPAHDSIFVHVKVTLDPNNQSNPLLITDSIVFITGHTMQDVDLLAYGQDAHFIVADHWLGSSMHYKVVAGENETVTWTNDKPYVVYGWAVVDSAGRLEIEPGTKIYFHSGSGLWVYRDGCLRVNGSADAPVLFRGDRTASWYDTDYAQWDRIWISEGQTENKISHAIITNAYIGLQLTPWNTPTYNNNKIENCIIHNTSGSAVLARASKMEMVNCQLSNNGVCCLQLETGLYDMKHVTAANYFSQAMRKNPAVYLSNSYIEQTTSTTYVGDLYTRFTNCILYGSMEDELVMKQFSDESLLFDNRFENCLIKGSTNSENFINCIRNQNPKFVDYKNQDFNLLDGSPAIDAGKTGLGITQDLPGNSRDAAPDLGAYEKQ